MKVLNVYGDDDYGVLNFQSSDLGKKPYSEVYEYVSSVHKGCYENEDFTIEALEFVDCNITKSFASFLANYKDYDTTKNCDWFIVD